RWMRLKTAMTRFKETEDDELASAYHAGNGLDTPYDRATANIAYSTRTMAFYHQRHVRRAAHMIAQAASLDPAGWLARIVGRARWWIIERRGRAFRPVLAPN